MNTCRLFDVAVRLPVHVVDTEGDFGVCTGEAVGLDLSGVVTRLPGPLPASCETTVHVVMPDGRGLVASAVVTAAEDGPNGWTYRLVFGSLEEADVAAIRSLMLAA